MIWNSTKLAKAFQKLTIKHAHLEEAKRRLHHSVNFSRDLAITVLTGPTGAGKTTAIQQFTDEILQELVEEMRANPSLRPVAYTLAVASGHKCYDFKRLFRDGLGSLADPFCKSRGTRNDGRVASTVLFGESVAAAALREQLEISFGNCETRIWVIDEAQHLIRGAAKGGAEPQFDILKSIAQTVGVRLVLCGTHDLPRGLAGSGQLSRRSEVIALDRYRWTVPEEISEFASAIESVMALMPGNFGHPDAKQHLRYFYLHTLGCVGIFKDWVTRAYSLALFEHAQALTLDHFTASQLSARQLATINNEIVAGELEYRDASATLDKALLLAILRGATRKPNKAKTDDAPKNVEGKPHDPAPPTDGPDDAAGAPVSTPAPGGDKGPKAPKAGNPFERALGRDVVGEEA